MNDISAFVEMDNKEATRQLTFLLDHVELPQNVRLTINNLNNAESGVLRTHKGDRTIDISLTHCFTMEDVARELIKLVAARK